MPDQLQLRGGTTAEHSTFTGAIKEVTVDTSKKTVVVHDGTTAGGLPLLRQDGSNSALMLGSEGTPSLKWDANTGIFSPGDDQLAIVTGANRAITITSTQAVGIKTPNPNTTLHVAGSTRVGADSAADAILEIGEGATGNRNSYIDIVADTTYTDYGLRIIRNNTGANATSELKHRGTGALNFTTQEAAPIQFYTTNSPALTILAGGNVGIGTSSVSAGVKLQVADGTASKAQFNVTGYGGLVLGQNADFSSEIDQTSSGANFFIKHGGTAAITVDTSRRVGIGETGPQGNLHIADATRANIIIKKTGLATIQNSTLSSSYDNIQLGAGGSFLSYNVETATADTHIGHNFYRHSNGNFRYKYTDAVARIKFNSSQGETIFDRAASGSADTNITFSESMRIDSSGRLLVGTSSAVAGTTQTASIVGSTLTQSTGLQSVGSGGTLDLALLGNEINGHLYVSYALAANTYIRTSKIFFIETRLNDNTVITELNTNSGSGGGRSFTITNPSATTFRLTDTSSSACTASMSFVGNMGA